MRRGQCVVVRMAGRGCLGAWGVAVDLSPAAFVRLAPLQQGVVPVQVQGTDCAGEMDH